MAARPDGDEGLYTVLVQLWQQFTFCALYLVFTWTECPLATATAVAGWPWLGFRPEGLRHPQPAIAHRLHTPGLLHHATAYG